MIIIYGPRQSGKITLIKYLLAEMGTEYEYFTGDDLYAQNLFGKLVRFYRETDAKFTPPPATHKNYKLIVFIKNNENYQFLL